MPKQPKNGSPKKRKPARAMLSPRVRGEVNVQATIEQWVREQGDARQSVRMLLRVIAWLMQHRDAWDSYAANVPFDDLDRDVDVGMNVDAEKRAITIAPAPVAPTPPEAPAAEEGTP